MKHTQELMRGFRAALVAACLSATSAHGAVIFTQNGDLLAMQVVNETYVMTAEQTDGILYVAFLNVFALGGEESSDDSRIGGSASISINGGSPIALAWWSGWQYRPGDQSPWTAEDAAFLLALTPNTLHVGDTVTVNGTLVMDATAPGVELPTLLSSSTKTVLGGHDFLYSDLHAVPEPSSALLLGAGVFGLWRRRR